MAGKAVKAGVVDSSVVVKWFSREKDTESALRLRRDLTEGRIRLAAPDLLLYELANALRYHPRLEAADVADAIDSIVGMDLHIVPASAGLLREAAAMAYERNITVYDAVFAALAAALGTPLITADEKLAKTIGSACGIFLIGRY